MIVSELDYPRLNVSTHLVFLVSIESCSHYHLFAYMFKQMEALNNP